jgi:hypothetical protein
VSAGRFASISRDVPPDPAVVVVVEVLGREQVGDALEGLVVEQQRAEHRLLRLGRVRRGLELEAAAGPAAWR